MEGLVERINGRTCDKISFFNRKCSLDALTGLTLLAESLPSGTSIVNLPDQITAGPCTSSMKNFDCIFCRVSCANAAEMKMHFQSKMHIATISKEIPRHTVDKDWLLDWSTSESSSSSSDSSSCEQDEEHSVSKSTATDKPQSPHGKPFIFFRNRKSEMIGIYRCLLYTKEAPVKTFDELLDRVGLLRKSRLWAFLLYSGGKFAGGIFDEDKELVHKTLHRYTVRKNRGSGQAAHDAALGGMSGHKSCGSNLRRQGEIDIRNDISHLLHVKWRSYLQACHFILVWTPKVNRAIFYTPPSSAPLSSSQPQSEAVEELTESKIKKADESVGNANTELVANSLAAEAIAAKMGLVAGDPRLRRLPCRSKNITYSHVKELQSDFSCFRVFEHYADLDLIGLSERRQLEKGQEAVFESRCGRLFQGSLADLPIKSSSLPLSTSSTPSSPPPTIDLSISPPKRLTKKKATQDSCRRVRNASSTSTSSSNSSRGARVSVRQPDQRLATKPSPSGRAAPTSDIMDLCNAHGDWHRALQLATATGDVERLSALLSPSNQSAVETTPFKPDDLSVRQLLNYRFPDGRCLLHLAVELQSDPAVVRILLTAGCRPDIRDNNGITPYFLASQLSKRRHLLCFKSFRLANPDCYDYEEANIPRGTHANANRPKARSQAASPTSDLKIAHKMDRLAMSERCASAADKRALEAQQKGKPIIKCNQCSIDITGKQPFSYMTFVFCSPDCLRKHRQLNRG